MCLTRQAALMWRAARTPVLAVLLPAVLAACASDPEESQHSGTAPCGAPSGDWEYVLSCDAMFAGLVHQCTDFYATRSAVAGVDASFRGFCQALQGTLLSSACPSKASAGSCLDTSSSGPTSSSPLAALSRTYIYGGSTSSFDYKSECEDKNGVYVPPEETAVPTPSPTVASCSPGAGGDPSSAVAFSIQVVANGQVVQCTNYIGEVTAQELASVEKLGALTNACPAENAICSCTGDPGSGTFGTDAQLVYYETRTTGSDADCPNPSGFSCTPGYSPP